MSRILDEILAVPTSRGGNCSMAALLAEMDAEDADGLRQAFAVETITHAAIAQVLKARGFNMAASTIGRHRRGDCTCKP